MNSTAKNVLAIITGLVIGSIVNGAIISLGSSLIPPPEGANLKTMEGLKAAMHLMEPKHFLMPWLAHALGTLVGAILVILIAGSHKKRIAYSIGFVFLAGGIANVIMLPSPLWFTLVDLLGAYLPMSFIACKIALKK